MGLLDEALFNDPNRVSNLQLGLGLLGMASPRTGGLLGVFQNVLDTRALAEQNALKKRYTEAQIEETSAQAAQRRAQASREFALQDRAANIQRELGALDAPSRAGMSAGPGGASLPGSLTEFLRGYGAPSLGGMPMFSMAGKPAPASWGAQPGLSGAGSPMSGVADHLRALDGPNKSPPLVRNAPNDQDALVSRLIAQANIHARHNDTENANRLYERAAQFMPSVHGIGVAMQGDQLVNVVTMKDGTQRISPFAPAPEAHYVDQGDKILPVDKRTQQPLGGPFAKGMTPGEIASHVIAQGNLRVAQDRLGVDRQRLAMEQNAPQYLQTEQGYVAVPKRPGPGPIAGQAVTGPNGETLGPPLKQIPASANTAIATNLQNLKRASDALALVQGKPVGSATGDTAATGWKGYLPPSILNRRDPAGVDARAAIADLGSLVIHDRSGAAVTVAEFPRLAPFIPQVTDDQVTVEKKLKRFVEVYQHEVNAMAETYSRDQGYRPNPMLQRGAAGPQGTGGASGSWEAPNLLPELPKANGSNRGKLIKDHVTGKTLRSDGFQWKEIQ